MHFTAIVFIPLPRVYASQDTKLCAEVVELYYKLYGQTKPQCLNPLEVYHSIIIISSL